MKQRTLAGAAAIVAAAAVVVVALVAGGGGGGGPRALPVLGVVGGTAGDEAAMTAAQGGGPGYDFTGDASGLPSEAAAWSMDREGGDEAVADLARAFGLAAPVATPEGWTAEGEDGFLTVERQPGLPWFYNAGKPHVDAGTTSSDAAAAPDEDAGDTATAPAPPGSSEPAPVPEPERPADLPSAGEAETIARSALEDAGVDLGDARTRVDDGFSVWVLVADLVVGGLPTFGMTSSVGVGSGGTIEFANGWLDDPSEGDTYDLVGLEVALERVAATGGWSSYGPGAPDPAVDCIDCEEIPEPEPIVLDAVEVGLQLVPAFGAEEAWLVPSYLFTVADGGPGAVVAAFAVADEHLVEPEPVDGEPGA